MRKFLIAGIAIAATLAAAVAGYRLGAGMWPDTNAWTTGPAPEAAAMPIAPPKERKVLYWRHPDSDTDFSAESKMADDGRPYVPVYEDQEADFAEAKPKQPPIDAAGPKKLLYYRNPMGLPDTSPVPKKDWMGMDYIPVYEGEDEDSGTVKVSAAKIQRSGVRSEPAVMRRLARPIRVPGIAKPDERTLLTVALRADSFIEKLYVNETGRHVTAGEPLFRVYSPDMVKVQVDYRISTNATGNADERGALQRLENLQLPQAVMDELRRTRQPVITFDWPSPVSGVVMKKKAIEGMMVRAGEEMMMLADLSSIWLIADVPEQEIGQVRIGSMAKVTFRAFPNEIFEGRVTFILHELEMATRTAKVRVQVANPDHRIKHEMFADVELSADAGEHERIAVPISALIDSGNRQVVIVDRGEGRFEPRSVKVGMRGDSYVEIAEGIKAGENVVVAANFLIDAESNLKAALSGFTADAPKETSQPAAKIAIEKKP
jgi:Cu(I)/Ag(I) efflux system membrane fusion protein